MGAIAKLFKGGLPLEEKVIKVYSLDDLFEMAREYGELSTGDFGSGSAKLHLSFTGEDRVYLYSDNKQNLNENIEECIICIKH